MNVWLFVTPHYLCALKNAVIDCFKTAASRIDRQCSCSTFHICPEQSQPCHGFGCLCCLCLLCSFFNLQQSKSDIYKIFTNYNWELQVFPMKRVKRICLNSKNILVLREPTLRRVKAQTFYVLEQRHTAKNGCVFFSLMTSKILHFLMRPDMTHRFYFKWTGHFTTPSGKYTCIFL